MTDDKRTIAQKINKILEKAQSTDQAGEAEVLMEKVHAMLEQHGLDLLDLGTLDADDPVGVDKSVATFWASASFTGMLASCAARYYGCETIVSRQGNKRWISVAGRESARVTFRLMFPFILEQVQKEASELVKQRKASSRSRAMTAVGNALAYRLSSLTVEKKDQSTETGKALIPVDMIDLAMSDAFPDLRRLKPRAVKTTAAAVTAAEGISLHRQATGKGTLRLS